MEKLNFLILPECGQYVVQGLELDIASQGKTIDDAIASFKKSAILQMAAYIDIGEDPFCQIGMAPQEYWDTFNNAERNGVVFLPKIIRHT